MEKILNFVKYFEKRKALYEGQLLVRKYNKDNTELLDKWIQNNREWLNENKPLYDIYKVVINENRRNESGTVH